MVSCFPLINLDNVIPSCDRTGRTYISIRYTLQFFIWLYIISILYCVYIYSHIHICIYIYLSIHISTVFVYNFYLIDFQKQNLNKLIILEQDITEEILTYKGLIDRNEKKKMEKKTYSSIVFSLISKRSQVSCKNNN